VTADGLGVMAGVVDECGALSPAGVGVGAWDLDRIWIMGHAVHLRGYQADLGKDSLGLRIPEISEAEEVGVSGGAKGLSESCQKEQRSLQNEPIRMRRPGESIEESFQCEGSIASMGIGM